MGPSPRAITTILSTAQPKSNELSEQASRIKLRLNTMTTTISSLQKAICIPCNDNVLLNKQIYDGLGRTTEIASI